jgi:probable phosphoglycerate mutase
VELLLIRHALPIRRELVDGIADPELADAGRRQAEHLAAYLEGEPLQAVYASPLRRAYETAEPLARTHGLPVVVDEDLAEYDREANEYVPVEELKASGDPRWHDLLNGIWPEGAEPREAFQARCVAAIEARVGAHPSHRIAIVCHGGVINAYVAHILEIAGQTNFFYPNYTSIHRIAAARSGERSILTLNETFHLRGTGLPIGLFYS